ncbi:hypothetical protein [Nocardioides sp.]|uniref:hypothetical protein n=1 Tax=Nocardioides sp. TaxID=35761 RepID=UPI003783CE61
MEYFTGLSTLYPLAVALLVVMAVVAVVALTALTQTLVVNRKQRVARHESIPAYYRRVVVSH